MLKLCSCVSKLSVRKSNAILTRCDILPIHTVCASKRLRMEHLQRGPVKWLIFRRLFLRSTRMMRAASKAPKLLLDTRNMPFARSSTPVLIPNRLMCTKLIIPPIAANITQIEISSLLMAPRIILLRGMLATRASLGVVNN